MTTTTKTLGPTALDVWRTWRALPWQNRPCFGHALGVGEFCWQRSTKTPSGMELHRVVNELVTRCATPKEEDRACNCCAFNTHLWSFMPDTRSTVTLQHR